MNKLTSKQLNLLEETFEDGKTDKETLYNAVRNSKISKPVVSEFLRYRKLQNLKELGSFEKTKTDKRRVAFTTSDDASDGEDIKTEKN